MSEVYQFIDNGEYHCFTPQTVDETVNTILYYTTIISRSAIHLSESFAKTSVQFFFERTHTYAKNLLLNQPEYPIIVTIFRNGNVYWKGTVIGTEIDNQKITIACDSKFTTLTKNSQQAKMMLTCRHALYSANCGVIQENWVNNYSVTGISTNQFTVAGITQPTGYFNNGIAVINGQNRSILKQVGTQITLVTPFTNVQSGILKLYPGCKLTESACSGFNNLANFGGFARMPTKNPFSATGLL